MARKIRVFVEDTSQHVLLKSIDSLVLFKDEADYLTFVEILKELNTKHDVSIHAYVLMPQYFEFLATPTHADALPRFMQSLGRKYVGYYNKKYSRTGTLWEGRYKSSLVEDSSYLFDVMVYIEKLAPKGHKFSSIHKNLYMKEDPLVSYNNMYKKLGFTDKERLEKYSNFFSLLDDEKISFIAGCLDKQLVTGTPEYIKDLEKTIGMTLSSKRRGRPKKQNIEQRKKMYKNLVVLDKEQHKSLKINPLEDVSFAKNTAFIPLLASEAQLVAQAFPVVFTGDENPSLVSIVSLGGESLAVNSDGKWITQYVPSHLRKYPFTLASTKENPDQKVILIDEDAPVFSKSKGKQLFTKSGEQSEVLDNAINFLKSHEQQANVTANVAKAISNSGILEDREISVGEGDEKKVLVNGFKVVDREKLNELSDDILADWVRKGIISVIDAHLKSLENIQTLFELMNKRQG